MIHDTVKHYGRKFTLALIAMGMGFLVTSVGLAVLLTQPSAGMYVAEIVGQFALVLSVSIGAFSGANAVVEWRHGSPQTSTQTMTTTQSTSQSPRPSGTVMEPVRTVEDDAK